MKNPILAGLTTPFLLAKASMFSTSEAVHFIAPGIEVDDAVITRILVSDARVDHEPGDESQHEPL